MAKINGTKIKAKYIEALEKVSGMLRGIYHWDNTPYDFDRIPTDIEGGLYYSSDLGALNDSGYMFSDGTKRYSATKADQAYDTFVLCIPRIGTLTNGGVEQTPAYAPVTLPFPMVVKRAYCRVGTAPDTGKTLAITLNGKTLASIANTDKVGESEAVNAVFDPNQALVIKYTETAAGLAADLDIMLVCKRLTSPFTISFPLVNDPGSWTKDRASEMTGTPNYGAVPQMVQAYDYLIRRVYVKCATAPGGVTAADIFITDGDANYFVGTITGAATSVENEALNIFMEKFDPTPYPLGMGVIETVGGVISGISVMAVAYRDI